MHYIRLLLLLVCCGGILPLQAQDTPTLDEIVLQRIEEARQTDSRTLDLRWLRLSELPPEIGSLNNVRYIYLNYNLLSELPPEIWQLTSLRGLNLNNNRLTAIPTDIGHLTDLQWLDLGDNQLTHLPEAMGQLQHLCHLNLRGNTLHRLPLSFAHLTSFISLQGCEVVDSRILLDGNPLVSPPPEVVAQGDIAIIGYLQHEHTRQAAEKQRLYLAGVSGVGLLVALMLGFRLKQRGHKSKKKRG
jgi:internalin A